MKVFAPDYYRGFHCIADKCRHSCCIGWEIDIDPETMSKYNSVCGEFGTRLKCGIKNENGIASFILGENERCPFLNQKGLCDIITELGKDHLSQICTDHPRFRNFFSDREELGLGLCCEEACRIILSKKEKTVLEIIEDDGEDIELYDDEKVILAFRERLFDLVQDRSQRFEERINSILELFGISLDNKAICKCLTAFADMEIMDSSWRDITDKLTTAHILSDFVPDFGVPYEQLLVYFIYRHIPESEDMSDLAARVSFAVLSVRIINGICKMFSMEHRLDFELLCDVCRMYSSEIEYCEENTEKLRALFL